MICDAKDIAEIAKELSKGFSEAQLEQIRQLITEALDKHLEEYMHSETPLTVAEQDEEDAQKEETK